MSNLGTRLRDLGEKLFRTGFVSVFFSSVLCKVFTFIGGMIVVRVLSKSDYGDYTYIMNCYGMLLLLGDLGCSVASMQFCNENYNNPQKFDAFFVYGVRKGILFSAITALLLLLSPLFYPFQQAEAARLTKSLCLMPFLTVINNFLSVNLRIRLENNRYAAVNVFQSVVQYLVILPLAYWFGVTGAVLSNYVIYALVLVFSLLWSRRLLDFSWHKCDLERHEKHAFLKLAAASQINNGVDHMLLLLDVFLIGIFIGESEIISSYKVATTIPTALAFIPTAMMVYVIPYFARNSQDLDWVRRNYRKLTLYSAGGNLLITAGCIVLAPWMIPLIFGHQYADAVQCFIILMVGYFFSATVRVPAANIIYTQRKVSVNILITAVTGVANCILDILLILKFGAVGAAWATTMVHILHSFLSGGYMILYLRNQG